MIAQFSDFHPFVTFFYYMSAVVLIMVFQHPLLLAIIFFIIVVIHFFEDRCRSIKKWLVLILISGGMIFIINPLFNDRGRHVLFEVLGQRFTLEATLYGATMAIAIMAIISLFVSYNEVMAPNKLLFLFSKILPRFAVVLMLTLRFIPLMKRRLDEISAVQQSKGLTLTDGIWRKKGQNGLLYVQVLLTYSLEEAIQTADSMNAREYGKHKRSSYEHFRFKLTDGLALTFLVLLLAAGLVGRSQGYGNLVIFPVMGQVTLDFMDWLYGAFVFLFLFFPLLVKGGSYLKWRLLNTTT